MKLEYKEREFNYVGVYWDFYYDGSPDTAWLTEQCGSKSSFSWDFYYKPKRLSKLIPAPTCLSVYLHDRGWCDIK